MRDTLDYQQWIGFGSRLRDLRLRRGMTQTALAKSLGFAHPSSISNIEKGRRPVVEAELSRIAEALNCSLEELSIGRR
ncbi:helix-turn-helix domain-containing protein [Ruegeria pomeroyi]|nr:helix-turn-helix transcriptional regulator [Ruegeria pomeroyi]